jgi:hypothetical protein
VDRATQIMLAMNPKMLVGTQGGLVVGLEDVRVDGRWFRLEYQSTPDGARAIAYCRHSPWENPYSYQESHVRPADGLLCLGTGHVDDARRSPMNLRTTIRRARFWCFGFACLLQKGHFPQPTGGAA